MVPKSQAPNKRFNPTLGRGRVGRVIIVDRAAQRGLTLAFGGESHPALDDDGAEIRRISSSSPTCLCHCTPRLWIPINGDGMTRLPYLLTSLLLLVTAGGCEAARQPPEAIPASDTSPVSVGVAVAGAPELELSVRQGRPILPYERATLVITLSNRSSTEVETSNLVDVAFANPPNLKRSPLMSPIRVVYGRATRSIDRLKLSGSRRRVSVPPNAALRALIPIRCYCDTGTDPLPLHPLPGSYPITLHYDRNHKGTKASQAFDAVVQIDEPHGEDAEVFRVIQGNVELQKALANAKAKVSRTTLMQLQELCRLYPGSRYADSLHATVVNVICGTLGTRLPTNSNTTSMRASLSHTSTKSGAHEVFERIDEYGFHPARADAAVAATLQIMRQRADQPTRVQDVVEGAISLQFANRSEIDEATNAFRKIRPEAQEYFAQEAILLLEAYRAMAFDDQCETQLDFIKRECVDSYEWIMHTSSIRGGPRM